MRAARLLGPDRANRGVDPDFTGEAADVPV
jgi:hypothetical protein